MDDMDKPNESGLIVKITLTAKQFEVAFTKKQHNQKGEEIRPNLH